MFGGIQPNYEPRAPRGNPVFRRTGVRSRIGYGPARGGIAKDDDGAWRRQGAVRAGAGRGGSGRRGWVAFGFAKSQDVRRAAAD